MDIDIEFYECKLKCLLNKFLEPNFQLKNDVYFDTLLSHLGGKENKELGDALLKLPILKEWLFQAVVMWEGQVITPIISVAAFSLHLTALICKDELMFLQLKEINFHEKLLSLLKPQMNSPSIRLAFMKLINYCLNHKSGTDWVISTNYWQEVLKFTLSNQTLYIMKEGHELLSALLIKQIIENEAYSLYMLQIILKPLIENINKFQANKENIIEVYEDETYKTNRPTLQLLIFFLNSLFIKLLNKTIPIDKKITVLLRRAEIEKYVDKFFPLARSVDFLCDLRKISLLLEFQLLIVDSKDGIVEGKPFIDLMTRFICDLHDCTIKNQTTLFLKYCSILVYCLSSFSEKLTVVFHSDCDKSEHTLETQFVILQQVAIFMVCKYVHIKLSRRSLVVDVLRDLYFDKVLKLFCVKTMRLVYSWRSCLDSQQNIFDIACQSISIIMQTKSSYVKKTAVLLFQGFIYSIIDVVSIIKKYPHYIPVYCEHDTFLKLLFDVTCDFIEEFNISWQDSVETINVLRTAFDFLNEFNWSMKLVLPGLRLVKLAIKYCMSADMVLLVDSIADSPARLLGPLLYAKLHDPAWQIRDSALEVIQVIAEMSLIKFPCLHKILEPDIATLVLTMALEDGESFVRTTALKVLAQMIPIDKLWDDILQSQEIPQNMMRILKTETEGNVRAEAAGVLTEIYKNDKINPNLLPELLETMISAALSDLYWEVCLKALEFWDGTVEELLHNQGMIDGAFPAFTFSGEHRKIVSLTETEVSKRLKKVLEKLGETGCLNVLMTTVSKDFDLHVARRATKIIKKLADLLKKYDIADLDVGEDGIPISPNYSVSTPDFSTLTSISLDAEDVISQIVGTSDLALLEDVHLIENNSYRSVDSGCVMISRKNVSCAQFLAFTKQDFERLVDDREKWLGTMGSFTTLLNDMLQSYGHDDDVNFMDCY